AGRHPAETGRRRRDLRGGRPRWRHARVLRSPAPGWQLAPTSIARCATDHHTLRRTSDKCGIHAKKTYRPTTTSKGCKNGGMTRPVMEFRVLGDLEVRAAGRRLEAGHARQRAVLAVLLFDLSQVVPATRLIDRVW